MDKLIFEINESQLSILYKFIDNQHEKVLNTKQSEYTTTVDLDYIFNFSSGIGIHTSVINKVTGDKLDLTEYDNW